MSEGYFKPISTDVLHKIIKDFVKKHGHLEKITMSAYDYVDIRKFGRDVLHINDHVDTMKKGYMASFLGIEIYVLNKMKKTTQDYVGPIQFNDDLTVCEHKNIYSDHTICKECIVANIIES